MAKTIEDAVYAILEASDPYECSELRAALGLGECGWDGGTMPPGKVCIACCDRMAREIAWAFDARKGK